MLESEPLERDNRDHQIVWNYYEGHPFFQRIQHEHSIFVKIMVIGMLKKLSSVKKNLKREGLSLGGFPTNLENEA